MADESGTGRGGFGAAAGDYGGPELAGGPSPGYGAPGWSGVSPIDPAVAQRARTFRDVLGRYGLSPEDLMAFSQIGTRTDYQNALQATIGSLGFADKLAEFGRGFVGRPGLYDLAGYTTPAELAAVNALTKGFGSVFGLPGLIGARALRGFMNIATARPAGFPDRSGGRGGEMVALAPPGASLSAEIDTLRAQREAFQRQSQQMADLFTQQAMQTIG